MHVWDEFSEFLPENRVSTSADFNTYPIRIFLKSNFSSTLNLFCYRNGWSFYDASFDVNTI